MHEKILTKSIRLTKEDSIGLADICALDPRVERGPSEALRLCVEDAAANIPRWRSVIENAKTLDYPADVTLEGNDTKTFLISEQVFETVFESVKTQLGLVRPRVSFIVRLCIYNTRLKLHASKSRSSAKVIKDFPVEKKEMLLEADKLVAAFKTLDIEHKLIEIYKLLLERII